MPGAQSDISGDMPSVVSTLKEQPGSFVCPVGVHIQLLRKITERTLRYEYP